jgi:hypothetical protein
MMGIGAVPADSTPAAGVIPSTSLKNYLPIILVVGAFIIIYFFIIRKK